jgi:16S rRNA processing protein RimM
LKEPQESQYLTIARIRKVQGRRGEVAAEVLTDFPERFQAGTEMALSGGGAPQTLYLEGVWFHKDRAILKFRGIETISQAETLVGRGIQIPLADRRPLPPGMVYLSDLVGCAVMEEGEILGKVESVEDNPAAPLLQVLTAQGEILIPFAAEICRTVDVERKEIHVRLPEGLKELNQRSPQGIGSGKQAGDAETAEVHDATGDARTPDVRIED